MDIVVDSTGFVSWTDITGVPKKVRCALGRGGIGDKRGEGDGITPMGRFVLRKVMLRSDRISNTQTALPVSEIGKTDGWCDDPASADYNRLVSLPHGASCEELWRDDGLYDVVIEVGFNDDPVEAAKGSAIFIHVARPDYGPTEGCVALKLDNLLDLLKVCDGDSWLVIG